MKINQGAKKEAVPCFFLADVLFIQTPYFRDHFIFPLIAFHDPANIIHIFDAVVLFFLRLITYNRICIILQQK